MTRPSSFERELAKLASKLGYELSQSHSGQETPRFQLIDTSTGFIVIGEGYSATFNEISEYLVDQEKARKH